MINEISWAEMESLMRALARTINASSWQPDSVVCIGRGGMLIGDAMSRLLTGRPPLGVLMASSYRGLDGDQQRKQLRIAEHISIASPEGLGQRVLLVDDLADTGISLAAIKKRLLTQEPGVKEVRTATLWMKVRSAIEPDFVAAPPVNAETWISMPFERV